MKRIIMLGPFGFHPNKTMAVRALPLAQALAAQGHTVQMIMPPWQTPAEADRRWQEGDVAIRYTPLHGGVPGIVRRMVQETLAWQPDVVHAFKPKAYSGLALWWLWQRQRRRLRLVMDSDDWEGWGGWNEIAPYSPLQKRFFAWQEQWGLRHQHALTVASRALETIALEMGIPRAQVVYVPNGPGVVASDAQTPVHPIVTEIGERPSLLLYTRLFEFDTARLVQVLHEVKTAVPTLAILLIGAGLYADDSAQFRQQLDAAQLTDSVYDVGWVEPAQLPALLAATDVGLYLMDDTLLNRTKCPVKLADMVAAGVPVVGEAVGQVPEYVVHGRSGLLRPSGNVAGLTADAVQLLTHPAQRTQFAAAARAHYEAHFRWAQLAQRLAQAYG